ncbi:MAG: AAA family ATPase [Gemmatimonadaceae bacterium]
MSHLRSVRLAKRGGDAFPFSVPAIRTLPELSFDTPGTYFVGENGSGKSTLLEGIALSAGLPTVGSREAGNMPSPFPGSLLPAPSNEALPAPSRLPRARCGLRISYWSASRW